MIRINDIIDKVLETNPDADCDLIERAYIYSARVHDGQVRMSGEPYLMHPLEVAGILADMKLDVVSIAAGLLHDVVEDTHATIEEIEENFGPNVKHLVDGVTKLSELEFANTIDRQVENYRKMILAMSKDIRVLLIKLADRIHNMRTLQYHKSEKRKREIAQETLDIYAPLASRMGIYWIKNELEDNAFRYTHPEEYEDLKNKLMRDQSEKEEYIEMVKRELGDLMAQNGHSVEVMGRYKNLYSIYRKMVNQQLPFEEIYDIIAFRIIMNSVQECWQALGYIHSKWPHIQGKFKDYIGRPKPNGYRSLHTTVFGPLGRRIEIQLRTREMDQEAKAGIAAHWSYKEGKPADLDMAKQFAWLQDLVQNQEYSHTSQEYLENVRLDLFQDEVYVFTPKGDLRTLPQGATPVDLAYLIHTDIGNQCTGAKVNGRIVPLNYKLKTGETVQILTTKNHMPSRDWLSFVKTAKARGRILQWIRSQEKERSVNQGKEMCEKEFRKHNKNFHDMAKAPEMDEIVQFFGFKNLDELMAATGFGRITPLQIFRKMVPKEEPEITSESLIEKLLGKIRSNKPKSTDIIIKGYDDIQHRKGKCCNPIPGDRIIGFITRGRGVTVHRIDCPSMRNVIPERTLEAHWGDVQHESYPVNVEILSYDRVGLLADITSEISRKGANILGVNSATGDDMMATTRLTLSVNSRDHLADLMKDIRKIKGVRFVKRLEN